MDRGVHRRYGGHVLTDVSENNMYVTCFVSQAALESQSVDRVAGLFGTVGQVVQVGLYGC